MMNIKENYVCQTIVEAVLQHAAHRPEKAAVCFKQQCLTYHELALRVRGFAWLLKRHAQIEPGDLIMISALSKPEYVVAHLAVQYLGAIVVPVDKSILCSTLTKLYRFVSPKLILTDSRMDDGTANKVSLRDWYDKTNMLVKSAAFETEMPPYMSPNPESIAEIIFTTGTTGEAKGAMLSYRAILAGTKNTRDGVHRHAGNIELLPLPLNHSFGLRVLRTLLYVGATIILQNGFMFPKEIESNLDNYGCTGISIVPASIERLYQNLGERFSKVFGRFSYMEIGAGSLSVGMKQKLLSLIPNVHLYNVWGSSETGGVIFLDITEHPEHIASLGIPVRGVEVAMLNGDGQRVAAETPETAGRMIMKGNMRMSGYYKLPEVTAKTIVDGYLYTGDLVYQTKDGFVYMLGRVDDIINVGGEKVSPVEVENVASQYGNIQECACVGWSDPDGVFGQIPVLFVVPEGNGFDEAALKKFLSEKLEQFKLPKRYVLLSELPRNNMKKIDRGKLKQLLESDRDGKLGQNPVIGAIHSRRSIRDFQERRIPRELLEQVVACGYQAPSGHNMQSWRFTVICDRKEISCLKTVISDVAKRCKIYFYGFHNPDVLILVSNDRRNPDGIQDSSCAAQNIMLAAHSTRVG